MRDRLYPSIRYDSDGWFHDASTVILPSQDESQTTPRTPAQPESPAAIKYGHFGENELSTTPERSTPIKDLSTLSKSIDSIYNMHTSGGWSVDVIDVFFETAAQVAKNNLPDFS